VLAKRALALTRKDDIFFIARVIRACHPRPRKSSSVSPSAVYQ